MATGRTISASYLTDKDKEVISLCDTISKKIIENIPEEDNKREFIKNFGKISYTRDGGMGVGAGKLQRDALCTRGRQGKAPFSNRNLRWHPLVVADNLYKYAKEIERIEIEGDNENQILIFVIKDEEGNEIKYPSDKAHEITERHVILPKHWIQHIDKLKHWSDVLWTQNSCVIPSIEACNWEDAVESYAVLGLAVAIELFGAERNELYKDIKEILKNQDIDENINLPSKKFPVNTNDMLICPMCKVSISKNAADIQKRTRINVWQPAWRNNKRGEGDDSSTQIMHTKPLIENDLRHNADNVRYGHRWCNVAMTDHSMDETLDFMDRIVKVHKKNK